MSNPDPEYDEALKKWNKHFNNPVDDVIMRNSNEVLIEGTPFFTGNATYSALQFTVSQYGSFSMMSDTLLQQGFDADDIVKAFGAQP